MHNNRIYIIFYVLLLGLSSCVISTNSSIFSNGESTLLDSQKELVVGLDNNSDSLDSVINKYPKTIYTVYTNAIQLKRLWKDNVYNVVYLLDPNCEGLACLPVSAFYQNSRMHNFTPWIVLGELNPNMIGVKYPIRLFMINNKYYGSCMPTRYKERFVSDLTNNKSHLGSNSSGIYLFKGKTFVKEIDALNMGKEFDQINK